MQRLKEQYNKTIVPKLQKEFGITNVHAVPKIEKIVVNVGVGKLAKDSKYIDSVAADIAKITGQTPVKTLARKSIAGFKVREGQVVGVTVTLRGERMYSFLDKLINIALPRVKDFRGVSARGFDKRGNFSLGLKEHIVFPEVPADSLENTFGFEITLVIKTQNPEQGRALLKEMRFPFAQED